MELPRRARGDELLKPGQLLALRERLRKLAPRHDLTTVIACAFDHRTRMLPFIYADTRMVPAGVPSLFHSSLPPIPSSAVKNNVVPTAVRSAGEASPQENASKSWKA